MEKNLQPNVVFQDNQVELIGTYGGDQTHALSAWTSTSRELTSDKYVRIPALLKMLAENGHHTPFEKSAIHFLVTTECASHIHIIKHRIGVSVNGESARYKELKDDKLYVPQDWDEEEVELYRKHNELSVKLYHSTLDRLISKGVPRKRAKESARFYLPYCNQTRADVMFNFRSFAHFIGLRYSEHAQVEIRAIAGKMLELVDSTGAFEHSLEAFGFKSNGVIKQPH